MSDLKTLKDIDVRGKKVLVRSGLDVKLQKTKNLDYRIVRSAETINYLIDNGASKISVITHIGRPNGINVSEFSVSTIRELFYSNIKKPDIVELQENLRFNLGEEENSLEFAKSLIGDNDVFIQDAFSVLHDNHASIVTLPTLMPSFAGLLVEDEVTNLETIINNPHKPFVVIIGGAKIDTKIPVISKLNSLADIVLVGGKCANEIIERKMFLDDSTVTVASDGVSGDDQSWYDIGSQSIKIFSEKIKNAKTVFWNGNLGQTEDERYRTGSREIAQEIIQSGARSIVGGGDTVTFIQEENLLEKFSFVSTGGGAMLQYIADGDLVGLKPLYK